MAQLALRHDARRAAPALLESVGWISLLPTVSAIRAVRPDPVGTPGLATGPLGPRAAVAAALHERDEPARAALVYASLAALDSPAQARATGLALLGISAELPADMKLPDPDDKWIGKHLVLVRNADDQKFTMECVSVALNATKKNQFEMQNMLESMRWTRYQLERCLSWLETSEVIPPGWARIRGGLARSGGQRAAAVSTLLHALRSVYEARPKDPRAGFVGNFVQGGDTRDALLSATREGSLGSRFGAAVVLTTADLGVVGPAGAPLNAQGQRSGGGGGGGVTKAGKEAHMKALRGNMDLLTGIFAVLKDSEAHRSQCEKLLDSADPNVKPKVGSERHGGLVFCVKTHQRVLDWTGAWVQKLNGSNKLPPDQIEALTTECRSEAAALLAEIEAELEGKPSTWRDTWTDLYSFRELAGVE